MNIFNSTMTNLRAALLGVALVSAYGCGSSGGGGGGGPDIVIPPNQPQVLVTGTAATGKALANATITLTDANGVTKTATSSASGTYTIDVTGLTGPFVIKATGTQGTASVTLVSVSNSDTKATSYVINVTPLTTVIAAMLSSTGKAKDLNPVTDKTTIVTKLTTWETFTQTSIKTTLTAAGLAADASPISTPFDADGTGYDSIYDNLQVGQTSKGEVFLTPKCVLSFPGGGTGNQGCYSVSSPGDQTTTNPNLCGFDIASGAGIPCDPSKKITETPGAGVLPPIDASGAVSVGGAGIHWGPADKQPPPNPLALTVKSCVAGTKGCPILIGGGGGRDLPAGFPTNVTTGTYVISGKVCATGIVCIPIANSSVAATDASTFANSVVSAFKNAAAGVASSGCSQSQSYTAFDGKSFSGTLTITCTSGGQTASSTVTLTMTKQ